MILQRIFQSPAQKTADRAQLLSHQSKTKETKLRAMCGTIGVRSAAKYLHFSSVGCIGPLSVDAPQYHHLYLPMLLRAEAADQEIIKRSQVH